MLTYTAGFLLWYSATPLGLYPVLDGREILALATRIANGDLPQEPFYRAALYPALLSLFVEAGVAAPDLAFCARLLNGLLHCVNVLLVWWIAGALWRSNAASALAAVLYGLNPVALHFAGDPLDISLAITLMLAGLHAGMSGIAAVPEGGRARLALASVCLALAVLARPHMLTVLLAWFVIVTIDIRPVRAHARSILAGLLPAIIVLGLMGAVNYSLSGDLRVLPWQGAYNLWSANRPGANGRYFQQATRIASYDADANPARIESERLFTELNPASSAEPASQAGFWRAKTIEHIVNSPLQWGSLLVRKAYYLINNFEQYNNKTYSLHKRRSPWLRWNPLCWALLVAGAGVGLVWGWQRAGMQGLALCAAAYTAGLLLTYVSARFRLPLLPLLAVMAGGLATRPRNRRGMILGAATGCLLLGLSLIPIARIEAEKTYLQDYLLLARANSQVERHDAALGYARRALARAPRDAAALELTCVAGFNAWLYGTQSDGELAWLADMCARSAPASPVARRVVGIVYWRLGHHAEAVSLWSELADSVGPERGPALAALLMTDRITINDVSIDWTQHDAIDDMLLLALTIKGDVRAADVVRWRMGPGEIKRQTEHLAKTFTRPERLDDRDP